MREHRRDWTAAWRVQKCSCRQDRPAGAPAARRRPFWPANRITKLRKLLGTLSKAAIARELGISKAAVFRQARRLALSPRRRATPVPS